MTDETETAPYTAEPVPIKVADTMPQKPPKPRPSPHIDRPGYDAARPKPRAGSHKRPTIAFRPEAEELAAITRAAIREGVARNDWLRQAALEKLDRDNGPDPSPAPPKVRKT